MHFCDTQWTRSASCLIRTLLLTNQVVEAAIESTWICIDYVPRALGSQIDPDAEQGARARRSTFAPIFFLSKKAIRIRVKRFSFVIYRAMLL